MLEEVRIINNKIHDCYWAGITIWEFPYWVNSDWDEKRLLEISGNHFYGNNVDMWKWDDTEWDYETAFGTNWFEK